MERNCAPALSALATVALLVLSCIPAASLPKEEPTVAMPTIGAPIALSTPAPGGTTATPRPAPEWPRSGGVLTRANAEDPAHLDIHQATSLYTQLPLANVYNGLVRFDPVNVTKVIADLAEKWDVSPDGKMYTFQLRGGVKWHDDKPFTSEDVKFSLERMAFWREHKIVSPRGGQMLSAVEKVEVSDPLSVKVVLKYPSASFLQNAASGWVLMFPRHVIQAKGDMKKDATGTGPFKWKEWNFGISQQLVKNPDYFVKGLPYLDGIKIYVIKDDSTRFAAFRTGQVKMTTVASKALTHLEAQMVAKEMADRATVITHAAATRYLLFIHSKRKPWDDLRVRKAVDLAFDRKAAMSVNFSVGTLGGAMHPKGAWGIPEAEMAKRPGYRQPKDDDVAKAKSLLGEAGYPQGFKTTLLVRPGGATEREGIVVRDQLAKIGVDAAVDLKESAILNDRLDRHDFDLTSFNPSDPTDDPDSTFSGYYVTGGSRNYGEFSDKQIDDLFQKQAAMVDEKERKKVVLEIQERILDLAIYPVIFWDVYNVGFWKEVRDYTPGFGATSHNILDHVWLAK